MYIRGIEKATGHNLLLFDVFAFKSMLLQNNFKLKDVEIFKKYPDSLIIKTYLKEPFAILKNKKSLILSEDGFVLSLADEKSQYDLPNIYVEEGNYKIGESVSGSLKMIVRILKEIRNSEIVKSIQVDIEGQEATFVLFDDTQIIVSLTKNNPDIAASLQIIMARFRIEGRQLAKIDFRFEKPIITLLNGEKITPK